jgi:hypothetical protein
MHIRTKAGGFVKGRVADPGVGEALGRASRRGVRIMDAGGLEGQAAVGNRHQRHLSRMLLRNPPIGSALCVSRSSCWDIGPGPTSHRPPPG